MSPPLSRPRSIIRRPALVALLLASAGRSLPAQRAADDRPYSFVVLGHVRGDRTGPNPKLGELLVRVRELRPSFVVLTGDMIWGDTDHNPADTAEILREWNHLDSALATLQVPVYRVPGNHDINDLPTRDLYLRRYGRPPQEVAIGGSRLLLLGSAWMPPDGDTRKMALVRTAALDTAQVSWLGSVLPKPGFRHTFVFMHDLLWWGKDDTQWWTTVHPMLARAGVDAVFSGDYGPLKFSTLTRDSVRYFQCSIETAPSLDMLRTLPAARYLSGQFDNFLETRVDGPRVAVLVHTVAEVSSGAFTPQHYADVTAPAPPEPLSRRVWRLIGSPKRLAAVIAGVAVLFALGWFARGAVARSRSPR